MCGIHTFAAEASMELKDQAGNVRWTLELRNRGNKEVITVSQRTKSSYNIVLSGVEIQSDSDKNAVIGALSRVEEMARNAKFQRLTTPMKKFTDPVKANSIASFAFEITAKGEHQMLINDHAYTAEQITDLKDVLRRLSSYAAELRKATKL
jgi:hypothetical protein